MRKRVVLDGEFVFYGYNLEWKWLKACEFWFLLKFNVGNAANK